MEISDSWKSGSQLVIFTQYICKEVLDREILNEKKIPGETFIASEK